MLLFRQEKVQETGLCVISKNPQILLQEVKNQLLGCISYVKMVFIFETLSYLALATIQQFLLCWDHRCMPHPAGETLLRSKDLITDDEYLRASFCPWSQIHFA